MKKHQLIALLALLALTVGCGGGIDKKGTKDPNNSTSNSSTNNVSTNNTATNGQTNSSTNNTTNNGTNNPVGCVDVAPLSLNFGVVEVGQSSRATFTLENCSSDVPFTIRDVTASDDAFQVSFPAIDALEPLQSLSVPVTFAPPEGGGFVGTITVGTSAGDVTVNVQGETPADPDCPIAVARVRAGSDNNYLDSVDVTEGTTVVFSGSDSTGNGEAIVSYEWTFASKPAGSTSQLEPSNAEISPTLFIDRPGTYAVDLRVRTANSPANCPTDRATVEASTAGDGQIRVELLWDTPADSDQMDAFGADLDLHYAHPDGVWNMSGYTCFWNSKSADWGADGLAELVLDDTDGVGPERIVHNSPGPKTYEVGVYYFADNGYGASTADVSIWIDDVLVFEGGRQLSQTDQFWHGIMVDASNGSVTDTNLPLSMGFPLR